LAPGGYAPSVFSPKEREREEKGRRKKRKGRQSKSLPKKGTFRSEQSTSLAIQ